MSHSTYLNALPTCIHEDLCEYTVFAVAIRHNLSAIRPSYNLYTAFRYVGQTVLAGDPFSLIFAIWLVSPIRFEIQLAIDNDVVTSI